ncbi:MAG TPA: hypothetical protein VG272_06475, partial [Candidatus Acidoferrales bacterium]|nr:hypothetical protein [Candidatus Acidoferrales bacterium]
MNVLRTVFFKKTGNGLILGAVTMMFIVLLHGTPAKAQNKDGQPQIAETIAAKLTEAEAVFQRTEAQIASRNMGEPAPENTRQSEATDSASGTASGIAPMAAMPLQNGQTGASAPAPATQQEPVPAGPPPSEEESHEHMMEIPHGP